jgi:hypothetical protein
MVIVGYHKRAGTAQQKGRRRNAETPMRLSDAPSVHAPFEGGRDIREWAKSKEMRPSCRGGGRALRAAVLRLSKDEGWPRAPPGKPPSFETRKRALLR